MGSNFTEVTEIVNDNNLQKLIHKLQPKVSSDMEVYLQNAINAGEFCSIYPHLDKEVVIVSLLLFSLVDNGYLEGGLQRALHILEGFDAEQKIKILNVILEAQSGYAVGEAKVVQYFCH